MNVLFYLGHPSQYHVHKNIIRWLKRDGHKVYILIRKKDVLADLIAADKISFIVIQKEKKRKGRLSMAVDLAVRELRMALFLMRNKTDLMIGSDASVAHISKLFGIPGLIFAEDDVHVIPHLAKVMYPGARWIISPEVCDTGKWSSKKTPYNGYQKLAYLHPRYFTPDNAAVTELGFSSTERNFLVRLSGLNAHHDRGIKGLNMELFGKIVGILEAHGKVIISSEEPLPADFEKYSFSFPPESMHHVLAFSDLLICDSQSMAVEAAILGVPSLRFNDFAGKISVLEELEHKYSLTFGFTTSMGNELLAKLDELLMMHDLGEVFIKRRDKMLSEKIDVAQFFLWLIEEYPVSFERMRSNPEYQYTFR